MTKAAGRRKFMTWRNERLHLVRPSLNLPKKIPLDPITRRLIEQLVGAGTSVGANYCEADDAVSKKDFRHKISICKREARESKFFLRMIVKAVPELRDEAKPLWQEAKELHLIFAKIGRS